MDEELKTKINYKTSDKIWGKVLHVKGVEGFSDRSQALDLLIIKGYKSWKDEQDED